MLVTFAKIFLKGESQSLNINNILDLPENTAGVWVLFLHSRFHYAMKSETHFLRKNFKLHNFLLWAINLINFESVMFEKKSQVGRPQLTNTVIKTNFNRIVEKKNQIV